MSEGTRSGTRGWKQVSRDLALPSILEAGGVRDERAKGFALGLASHGIGTARAFQISETAGVFASIGMILNALLTILLVPLLVALL